MWLAEEVYRRTHLNLALLSDHSFEKLKAADCKHSDKIAPSFNYDFLLDQVFTSKLNYGSGIGRYFGDTDHDAEVINRVLYGHRAIPESKQLKNNLQMNRHSLNGDI